ncbi:MAG TPA: GAF domain-containing sensor histidine kinase [Dehalococcoidia bacterium]|nr:GAF domain-containing sensor histidine kinase [Dehalococcoidia bacterium]
MSTKATRSRLPQRKLTAEALAIENARLFAQAEERTRELESLLRVSQAVASTLDLDQVMLLFLAQLKEVIDYDCASLILIEGSDLVIQDIVMPHEKVFRQENRVRFTPCDDPDLWVTSDARPGLDTPCVLLPASADFWRLMRNGESHLIEDALTLQDDILAVSYRKMMGDRLHSPEFMRSWMATPLHGKDGTIGYFGTSSATPAKFNAKHIRLARAFADQATVAIENARLYSQGQKLAVAQERQRVARDLHDSVAQTFYGVALGAKTARRYITADPAAAVEPIDYVISLAAAGLAEMRALIFDLYPESLQSEGVIKALDRQVEVLPGRYGIDVEWLRADEPDAPVEVKEAIYTIIREALHNAVKHAQTQTVSLSLEADAAEVRFSVRDFGTGFDVSSTPAGHMGLKSMEERARRLGGRLRIDSSIGEGTVVTGSIPLRA